jgi:Pentapeptide repeats (9 copies)
MRPWVHRERPEPWSIRRRAIKRAWSVAFWAFEWCWEWTAYVLSNWSFLAVLDYLGSFGVLLAVVFYFSESGNRLKQKHYQAWQVINTAQGKGGNGGRIDALQELNIDGVPLVGVDVSGAFLQGIRLERCRLVRSNFSAVDARDSDFSSSDFSDSDLLSANFRRSSLRDVSFQRANLERADLTGADLSNSDFTGATFANADLRNTNLENIRWRGINNLKNANLFGARNAPDGFLAWALQHGAIQAKAGSE